MWEKAKMSTTMVEHGTFIFTRSLHVNIPSTTTYACCSHIGKNILPLPVTAGLECPLLGGAGEEIPFVAIIRTVTIE